MADDERMRPIHGDPAAACVVAYFDLAADDWLLSTAGEYQTAAAETMRNDGSGWQRTVILEWPCRRNHTTEESRLRLMISPEDALGLAEVLTHTAEWLIAAARKNGGA